MKENIVVKVPTRELWRKVVSKAFNNGYVWAGGDEKICDVEWERYKENSCIDIGYDRPKTLYHCSLESYQKDDYPIISAEESLKGSGETISQPKKTMNKLNSMMKRLLDKDSQTLYKANFINGDLELTEKGHNSLMAILFTANKAELVKQAEDELKEEKEEK